MFHANYEGAGDADQTWNGYTGDSTSGYTVNTPVRDGYEFAGWYKTADCSGANVRTLPETFPPNTTEYWAKWTAGMSQSRSTLTEVPRLRRFLAAPGRR